MSELRMSNSTADHLAKWASALNLKDVNSGVVHEAKRCLIDVVGCAFAGTLHPVTKLALEHAAEAYGGSGCSTVFGTKLGATGAALVNGTAAHSWDFDDTCYEGITHPSAVIWPAVQAAAELSGCDGSVFLCAIIAGIETVCAVARGIGSEAYLRGWFNTGALGMIGAATGSSRALGLSPEQTSNAIRIAATSVFGMRAFNGTSAKPFAAGGAARSGVEAALAARRGFDGPAYAFEDTCGLARIMAGRDFDREAAQTVGLKFSLKEPGIAFKLFPACSATQAGIEAVLDLRRTNGFATEDISEVFCEVTPLIAMSLPFTEPETVTEAQFSMNFGIAAALIKASFSIRDLNDTFVKDEKTRVVMSKVKMAVAGNLIQSNEDALHYPEATKVTIRLKNGIKLDRTVRAATGMPTNRASDAVLCRKFVGNLELTAPARESSTIYSFLSNIENASPQQVSALLLC